MWENVVRPPNLLISPKVAKNLIWTENCDVRGQDDLCWRAVTPSIAVAILSHPSTTPPRGSLLYAVEVPYNEHGEALGETLFVSSAAAYEALPAARQQQLLGLRAMHRAGAKQYVPGSQLADAV